MNRERNKGLQANATTINQVFNLRKTRNFAFHLSFFASFCGTNKFGHSVMFLEGRRIPVVDSHNFNVINDSLY